DRLSGLGGAAAARGDRHSMLTAQRDGAEDVFTRARDDHAEGDDLVDAGVGRVEGAGEAVEAHFAADLGGEFAGERSRVQGRSPGGKTLEIGDWKLQIAN